MEIAGIDTDSAYKVVDAASAWDDAIVEDGSLPDSGFEINTNPTNGDAFLEHIAVLTNALSSADARVDRSCGMHCHVDARDYSYYDLYKLLRLYVLVEDSLFSLVSPSRRNGRYSSQCADTYRFSNPLTFKKELIARLYGPYATEVQTTWNGKKKPSTSYSGTRKKETLCCFNERYAGVRYNALNIHSWFYRRTIEFRHHQGSAIASKATSWALVCAAILDSASRMTEAQIDALPYQSFDALLAVTPASLHEWMRERRNNFGN